MGALSKKLPIFLGILLVLFFLSGCNLAIQPKSGKIIIVTTLFPFYEFAQNVGGDKVDVTLLLPPGAEAHTFEPKPSDLIKIEKADLFIYNGVGLEPWAKDILDGISNKQLTVIEASSYVDLINTEEHIGENISNDKTDSHGVYDPHIWLDFKNDLKIVDEIAAALSKKYPVDKNHFLQNAEEYKKSLELLDNQYILALSNCQQHILISGGHNSLTYLGQRYNFSLISVFGISPNSEPTPQKIVEITNILKENNIRYVLFEEMIDPKISDVLARESGAKTIVINPGHNILRDEFINKVTFLQLMERNLESFKAALECK